MAKVLVDCIFGLHVHGTCRLVQDYDLGLAQECPRQRHFLPLADTQFRSIAEHSAVKPYPIPYRCLYSKDIANLMMAGRDISATQIALQLHDQGLEMVEVGQRFSTLSEPSKAFEAMVISGQLTHDDNRVMRWMVDCVSVVQDANDNIRPAKPDRRKSSKRIDGVAAAVNALFCLLRHEGGTSVYEERGVLVLDD